MNEIKEHFTNNEIYEILKNEIVSIKLKPGQYIGEIEMAKRFNVSRTPIREVFKHLEYDNLLKVIRNKGTVVTAINFSKILKFMFVREKVEFGVMEDIAGKISAQSIANLNLLLLRQKKILTDSNVDLLNMALEFFSLDNEFHRAIFDIENKASVWDMLANLMPDYRRYRMVSAEYNTQESLYKLYEEHCNILKYLELGDMKKLKLIYEAHIYSGVETFNTMLLKVEDYFVI